MDSTASCPPDRGTLTSARGPAATPDARGRARTAGGVRPEIQALRALAVALVVGYHLWPSALPAGFVGVDTFFVISGFLITGLLLRELEQTGRLALASFWARRARRILPAAVTVGLTVAAATVIWVPLNDWEQYFGDLRASALYVQNWHLAATAVDYFAASNAPSPVQHFWSLAVEEQFYLVWPLAVLGAALLARGARHRTRRAVLAGVLGAITLASLVYGIAHTASHPADAYFATTTRAWELGAGALLALAPQRERSSAGARSALSWLGLAAIVVAALTFTPATPFPGTAALLPVLGAIAVIRAGAPSGPLSPLALLRLDLFQRAGDLSYGIYLWHWPLLTLAPFALGHGVTTTTRLEVLMLTLVLAWLTKRLIEDPIRRGRGLLRRRAGVTFVLAAAATAVVVATTVAGTGHVRAEVRHDAAVTHAVLASHPACFGAASRDAAHPCHDAKLAHEVVPTPVQAPKMDNAACQVVEKRGRLRVCAFGAAGADAQHTVALIGDSHASHWRSALAGVVDAEHWRGLSITHTSCPYSNATAAIDEPGRSACVQWKHQLRAWLRAHPEVDTVVVGQHSGGAVVLPHGGDPFAAQVKGYTDAWNDLPQSVAHVLVLRDTPKMRSETMACVQRAMDRHADAGRACAQPRGRALERDPAAVAAARATAARVQTIDMTPYLCGPRTCPPVIGGALVYKDIHHLTSVYATTLAPYVQRRVGQLMRHWA